MKTKILFFFSVVAGTFLALSPAHAVTVHTPSLAVTLKPGDTLVQQVGLSDPAQQGLTVFPGVGRFVDDPADASGMRLVQESAAAQSWILPDGDHLDLPSDGSAAYFGFTLRIPTDAAPGAYALALLFSTAPTANPVARVFHAQDVLPIFLTVAGSTRDDVTPALRLVSSDKTFSLFSHPVLWQTDTSLIASFTNTGNTFLRPYGVLEVQNQLVGSESTWTTVNAAKQLLLPGASRMDTLADVTAGAGFGKYAVRFTTYYGTPQKTLTVTQTFWLFPPPFVLTLVALILLGGLLLLSWIFLARRRSRIAHSRAGREKELRRVFLNPRVPITKRSTLRGKKNAFRTPPPKPARRLDGPQRSPAAAQKALLMRSSVQPGQAKLAPSKKLATQKQSMATTPVNRPAVVPAKRTPSLKKRAPRKSGQPRSNPGTKAPKQPA